MKRVQVGAALLVLAAASYAQAAPPEAYLGRSVPVVSGPAKGSAPNLAAKASARAAARYARTLGALVPEGAAATRGARDSQVYQATSPAVVLVLSKDGLGSGALISADGQIVTNLHVVGADREVGVVFKPAVEGQQVGEADVRKAKVIRRDEVADLALIQVSETPPGVKPLAVGAAADVQVGSDVHAIGHPTGEAWTYTRGIVSQIRRDYAWRADDKLPHKATVIQTQTPINPGNSGGPLIDDALALVGINSFKGDGEGLNFAVSADDVRAFLARPADRLIDPAVKAEALKPCEEKVLKTSRSTDPVGDEALIDEDCDGVGDYLLIAPDDKREPIMALLDRDGDGKLDAILFDNNRDGWFDRGLYDTDGDGKFDMEGRFRKGEDQPYRYDRIKPQ